MTTKQAEQAIRKAVERFEAEVERIAEEARRTRVIPYCDRRRVEFFSGMGRWSFADNRKIIYQREVEPPQHLAALLDIEVDHMTSLGDWMESYNPEAE